MSHYEEYFDESCYQIAKSEIERYTTVDSSVDPDRYGIGGNILRVLLAALAAHALSGDTDEAQAKQADSPSISSQPFEQLHPRETVNAGQKHAGQFAPKPNAQQSSPLPQTESSVKPAPQPAALSDSDIQQAIQRRRQQDHLTSAVAEKWHGKTTPNATELSGNNEHGNADDRVSTPESVGAVEDSDSTSSEPGRDSAGESDVGSVPEAGQSDTPPAIDGPVDVSDNGHDRELDDTFDPEELEQSVPEQPEAAGKPLKRSDVATKFDGNFDAFDQAKKDRESLVRQNRKWTKDVEENPDRNIDEIAAEYEMDPAELRAHAESMQQWEQDEWNRREQVKTQIRKAWGVHSGTLRDMENKGLDHNSLKNADGLYGSLDTALLQEHLGPDEHLWADKAWSMLREDQTPKPGMHDKNWLRGIAEQAYNKQMTDIASSDEPYFYDPGEDDFGNKMPFSRKSLGLLVDRYFQVHREKYRRSTTHSTGAFWTSLDRWL